MHLLAALCSAVRSPVSGLMRWMMPLVTTTCVVPSQRSQLITHEGRGVQLLAGVNSRSTDDQVARGTPRHRRSDPSDPPGREGRVPPERLLELESGMLLLVLALARRAPRPAEACTQGHRDVSACRTARAFGAAAASELKASRVEHR